MNNEIGIMKINSHGKININKYIKSAILIPLFVIYFINDIALLNHINDINIVAIDKN